jgi:phosphatidylglycerophosphate synthase
MDPNILASQKKREMLAAFWPRKISRYITRVLVRTPITPNQTTVLWGTLSVLNSYTVYVALTGGWWLVPLIPIIYQFCFVLDCVDGEIARFKGMSNPVGGKLLDGICHRATEFALLATFGIAAYEKSGSWLAVSAALLLMAGDAMYVFAYERRLTTLRQSGFKGHIRKTEEGTYTRGMPWGALTRKQQLLTITGLFHYKSVYAVIGLSYFSPDVFVAGLAALAFYKHWKWVRLVHRTLSAVSALQPAGPDAQPGADATPAERTEPARSVSGGAVR